MASLMLVAAATLPAQLVRPILAPTNMVMIYLLAVVMAALRLGLKPAILTAFLGVSAFDFFFVPPHLTFAVADTQYLITFAAFLRSAWSSAPGLRGPRARRDAAGTGGRRRPASTT